jgi:Protein of unknown function (DUF1064)
MPHMTEEEYAARKRRPALPGDRCGACHRPLPSGGLQHCPKGGHCAAAAPLATTVSTQPRIKNRTVVRDGRAFDSGLEADHHRDLELEEKSGMITDLRRQVSFPLVWNEVLICSYVADHVYFRSGKRVVEDSKGVRTEMFKLKKKMMKAAYGIDVIEVTKESV